MRQWLSPRATALSLVLLAACQDATTPVDHQAPQSSISAAESASPEGYPTRGELRRGFIMGRGGEPLAVTYEVQNGMAVFEGDIILGPAATMPRTVAELHARVAQDNVSHGIVIDGAFARWPGGVVPYEIDPGLVNPERITAAIALIHAAAPGVSIVPRTTQTDYIRFITDTGCASYIGRISGMQNIWLAPGCTTGSTAHELMHALGMFHEQSRCDRDNFVQIVAANILPGYENNFEKVCDGATDISDYNEGSLMHYPTLAFSSNGQPTIISLRGLGASMGQRNGPNASDAITMNHMYTSGPVISVHPGTMVFDILKTVSDPLAVQSEPFGGNRAIFSAGGEGRVKSGPSAGSDLSISAASGPPASAPLSTQPIRVTNTGGGSLTWTATDNQAWLTISPAGGTLAPGDSAQLQVTVDAATLNAGAHNATITVSGPGATSRTVLVTVNISTMTGLVSGVTVTDLAGAGNSFKYFVITVPPGATGLSVAIFGGSGDADLYVRAGLVPTQSLWDCRPFVGSNNETCNVTNPAAGPYFVMLHGFTAYTGMSLTATVTGVPTVPGLPTAVLGAATSPTTADLTWVNAGTSETRTEIQRRIRNTDGTFGPYAPAGEVAAGVQLFNDTGLLPGREYRYRIRACNLAGCSAYVLASNAVIMPQALPNAPLSPTLVIAGTTGTVGWTDASNNETRFEVFRRDHSGDGVYSAYSLVNTTAPNATSYLDASLVAGRTYQYRIRACSAAGCSAYVATPPRTALVPPQAPGALLATIISGTVVNLVWVDSSSNEASFEVYRRLQNEDGSYPAFALVATLAANSSSYSNTGLTAGKTYQMRVRACNAAGCSAYTAIARVNTPVPPLAPTGPALEILSATSLRVRWVDASDNELRFEISRRQQDSLGVWSSYAVVNNTIPNRIRFDDLGLATGFSYQYRIRACNVGGCSAYVFSDRKAL